MQCESFYNIPLYGSCSEISIQVVVVKTVKPWKEKFLIRLFMIL